MTVDGNSPQVENPLEPRKVPRFPGYFTMLGPGIVWMALAQGSGELIWWPYLVAKYGLGFVFLLIPACLVQVPLLYNVGHYTVLTGESIFQGFFRVHRRYLLFLWVLFIVHFLWFGAFASAGATALVELTGLPPLEWFPTDVDPKPYQRLVWAYFMIAVFAGAVLLSKVVYTLIERIMWLVATVTVVGLLAACFHPEVSSQIGPDWRQLEFPATTNGIPRFFRADPDHEGMVKDQQVRRLVKLKKNEKTLTMAAAKAGLSRKTARKYLKSGKLPSQCQPERYWRTRSDPFESVWPEVEEILKRSPTVEATAVFEYLCRQQEGAFQQGAS